MVSRQLVEYAREQIAHGMKINDLRSVLAREGWSSQDVEAALGEVIRSSKSHNAGKHETHFLAIAIISLVVILLAVALYFIVLNGPDITSPTPNPTPTPPSPPKVTGWTLCAQTEDSVEKDQCYQNLVEEDQTFSCDTIKNSDERGFCYRAKDAVLLSHYI